MGLNVNQFDWNDEINTNNNTFYFFSVLNRHSKALYMLKTETTTIQTKQEYYVTKVKKKKVDSDLL